MNSQKIRFNCPACGIRLDVPAALAGVSGPCPSCQSTITAPHPQPEITPAPAPAQQPPSQQPEQPVQPQIAPIDTPQAPQQQIPSVRTVVEPSQPELEPQSATSQQEAAASEQSVFPTVLPNPVEPTASQQLRAQVHATPNEPPFPVVPQPAPHANQETSAQSGRVGNPTKQSSRIPSLLFILAFVTVATFVIFFLLKTMGIVGLNDFQSPFINDAQPTAPTEPAKDAIPHPISSSDSHQITIPEPTIPLPAAQPATTSKPEQLPAPEVRPEEQPLPKLQLPEGENYREGETPLPEGLTQEEVRELVPQVLEEFLKASSWQERVAISSLKSTQGTYAPNSVLAGRLPEASSPIFLNLIADEKEGRYDYFYAFAFDSKKKMRTSLSQWNYTTGREMSLKLT